MKSLFLLFLACEVPCMAQSTEWVNLTYGEQVSALVTKGDVLWIGTFGGLVRLEKKSGQMSYYTKANANLPENQIRSLAIDSTGKLWIGTQRHGVGRFDGTACEVFNSTNSGLPYDYYATEIEVDSAGNLWFGTERYLSKYDGSSWRSYNTTSRGSTTNINKVVFDKGGFLWVATDMSGLGKFTGDTVIQKYDGFERQVTALALDSSNCLWVGEYGLIKYDGITKTNFNITNSGIPSNIIWDMKFDSKGILWMASGAGLVRYDGVDWETLNAEPPMASLYRVEVDEDKKTWVGSLGDGLARFDGAGWKKYRCSNSGLLGNTVISYGLEAGGIRWISCSGPSDKLIKFDGTQWEYIDTTQYAMLGSKFKRTPPDSSRKIWIGSDVLISHDDSISGTVKWRVYTISNRNKAGIIKADKLRNIWEATNKGLRKFDGSIWSLYNTGNSPLPNNKISKIAFDAQDNLWLSTIPSTSADRGRLMKFDGTTWWTIYTCEAPYYLITGIVFDSVGNIWISIMSTATVGIQYGGGIKKFDGSNWTGYDIHNSGLPSNSVADICLDKGQNLWIGTYGGGLAKFDGKDSWTIFDQDNSGLPNNNVDVIEIDGMDNKWIAPQNSGLTVFREGGAILTGVPEPKISYIPTQLSLSQNYPNPFNPSTTIAYSLPRAAFVSLRIFNTLGQEIAMLVNQQKVAGYYQVQWNANVPSGIYFYRLQAGEFVETKKMILMK